MTASLAALPAEPLGARLSAPVRTGIVGATGAVGTEMLACLEKRGFPVSSLRLFASGRSAGRNVKFRGEPVRIEEATIDGFAGLELVLFSAGAEAARALAPAAVAAGAVVIDNSSAFRMEPWAPLVVPEVNGEEALHHQGLIANPNCSAAIAVMALAPLHAAVPLRRVIGSTYQAASGAGAEAVRELWESTSAYLQGRPYAPQVLKHPYAFNLFSHDSAIDPETGCNGEETKVAQELRRLLAAPGLGVGLTCVRVPVLRAHTLVLTLEFERALAPEAALELLRAAPGVSVVHDAQRNRFPMPVEASGRDEVLVGRVRRDPSDASGRSLSLMVAGDQLLKGAALNAVQIAEMLLNR